MGMMDDIFSVAEFDVSNLDNLQQDAETPSFLIEGLIDPRLNSIDGIYVADPFVFSYDDKLYLFFELLQSNGKGVIAKTEWNSKKNLWGEISIVVSEQYHLSYPQLHSVGGEIYMSVESAQNNDIHLYISNTLQLNEWSLAKLLVKGEYYDPTIFCQDDTWYMFACSDSEFSTLDLFLSEGGLLGEWRKHPASPVVVNDTSLARSAGPILKWRNKNYRLSQDCSIRYGRAVNASEIISITPNLYKEERKVELLKEGDLNWNKSGMHHLQLYNYRGNLKAVTDGYYTRS